MTGIPVFCIPAVLIAFGGLALFFYLRRRATWKELVPAEAGDPAAMGKDEWKEKYKSWLAKRNRKALLFFAGYVALALVASGLAQAGPGIVAAWQPTATYTPTPMPTYTPRPTYTATPSLTPYSTTGGGATAFPSFTPYAYATPTARTITNTIYQTVVVTRVIYVTVIVTATTVPPATFTPSATPTSTLDVTPTPTLTETPTPTPSETPTPTLTPSPTPTPTGV